MPGRLRLAAATILLLSTVAPAGAATVAEWNLAGANAGVSGTVQVSSTAAHVNAGLLTANGSLQPALNQASTFVHLGWPNGPAPDPAKYLQFSVSPAPGYAVEYDTLSLAVASGGSGTGAFEIRASLDGFATGGQVVATRTFPKDGTWHAFELDLSVLGTQSLAVTFRFSMYQVGGNGYSGLGTNPAFGNQGRNLAVNATVIQGEPPTGCLPGATTLCIDDLPGDRRFQARVDFETTQGSMPAGAGGAISLGSLGIPSGGIFWFTNSQNPEMLLKVLNGCAFNQHYWVFYAAGTNFALRTEVEDTSTGAVWVRTNPDRTQAPPFADLLAFPCAGQPGVSAAVEATVLAADALLQRQAALESWVDPDGPGTALDLDPRAACTANANTLCIDDLPGDRRFEATVFFATTQGSQPMGFGTAIPLTSVGVPSGGIFWFTNPQNPEMMLKVLNGCSFNQRYWVFYAAGTNFGLEVEVTDTVTGATWRSTNPDRRQAPPIGDIQAFPCQAP